MAKKCVCEDRNQSYGEPEDNFCRIARLWEAYLRHPVSALDVANMMILFKVARVKGGNLEGTYTVDSWVDIAGYAACGGEIEAAMWVDQSPMMMSGGDTRPPAPASDPDGGRKQTINRQA